MPRNTTSSSLEPPVETAPATHPGLPLTGGSSVDATPSGQADGEPTTRASTLPASLGAFVPCWALPYRFDLPLGGRRWSWGHRWDLVAHSPSGSAFVCARCGAALTPEIDHVLRTSDGEEIEVSRDDFISAVMMDMDARDAREAE